MSIFDLPDPFAMPDPYNTQPTPSDYFGDIRQLQAVQPVAVYMNDKMVLEYLLRHGTGSQRDVLMDGLGIVNEPLALQSLVRLQERGLVLRRGETLWQLSL